MSATSTTKPSILFLGATGGCTLTCLTHALLAGYPCTALVRTPSKLTSLLLAQTKSGLTQATLDNHLTIITGNALSSPDVRRALLRDSTASPPSLPSIIVSGLGGSPQLQFPPLSNPLALFTLDNPSICGSAAATLIDTLRSLSAEFAGLRSAPGPLLTFISTTGITRGPEDVPFWIRWLYHGVLAVPHIDKRNMEDLFRAAAADGSSPSDRVFRAVVGIRPTLLAGLADVANATGLQHVRAGTEPAPQLGYIIRRADVGEWIFHNVVEEAAQDTAGRWEGEMVSLTT